ncbi:MAG: GntR family transcriptional regulator [Desulfovibrio sp.]|uniref:GntR family transcriptional regulator n=1 Tax=Desulfovibrio sp. 7SRBS1 TaxID=3378064 RepID=UPI003B3E7C2B
MTKDKQRVYEALKYRIITQELAPGAPLKDKDVMEEYGIGRTPLREVFLQLQNEGLIKRVPRSGTWVAPMDFRVLREVTEIRVGLEGMAGELAAERITEAQIKSLEKIIEEVDGLREQNAMNVGVHLKYEGDFHSVVYASIGNPQLEKLLRDYQGMGARFWHSLYFSHEHLSVLFEGHRALLESLKKRDKVQSKKIAEDHVREVLDVVDQHCSGWTQK